MFSHPLQLQCRYLIGFARTRTNVLKYLYCTNTQIKNSKQNHKTHSQTEVNNNTKHSQIHTQTRIKHTQLF
jgi:hypothetical protein